MTMQDIQSSKDYRHVPIAQVGIKDVSHPMFFSDLGENNTTLASVGNFSLSVALPSDQKGTHMSRFMSVLYEFMPNFSIQKSIEMTSKINNLLESTSCFFAVDFSYFYEKQAPVSKTIGLDHVLVRLEVENHFEKVNNKLVVTIPITSLCPCSKAISEFGAHNQRGHIKVTLWNSKLGIKNCIEIAENAASCALYPVLKRADEKYVTEAAYQKPRFVEDLVREAAVGIKELENTSEFEVLAENFESIHNHNAWALVKSADLKNIS